MVLSKSEILNGSGSYKEYEMEALKGETIALRPLSIGEIHAINEMKNKALGDYIANQKGTTSKKRLKSKIEAQTKINMGKTTIADNKADVKIVMLGLDNKGNPEKWDETDVRKLDEPLFTEILEKVKEISHLDDDDIEDDVDDFPEEE